MSEEEIIYRLNSIIKEWQEIVNIKDKQEREIEMSMYIEDMPFYEIQGLLDLYNKEKEKYKALEQEHINMLEKHIKSLENDKNIILELQKELDKINLPVETLVAEFERLENIEDRYLQKIQEVIDICNKTNGEFATLPNNEIVCISDCKVLIDYLKTLL